MVSELHANHGKVTLDTIRRLYRRNFRVTLYKLVQKPILLTWRGFSLFYWKNLK